MSLKTEAWDFFKRNFGVMLVGVAFFMFYTNGCKNVGLQPKSTSDTVTKVVQVLQPLVIAPPYQPQQVGPTVYPITIPQQFTPSNDLAELKQQYNELLKNYLGMKTYKDSIELKDTSGKKVGVVNLTQTVAENTLKSTQPSYQLMFPEKITTITNTVYPKAKNKLFVGVTYESLLGTVKQNQVGAGFLFQNKKENTFSLLGKYSFTNNQPGIQVGYFQKLSFKIF